jgi:exonuclease SbcC
VELEGLVEHIAAGEATVRRVREYVEPELQWLSYVHELLVSQAADLDEAIAEEQDRAKEQQNLLAIQNGIRSKRDEVMARIDLRRKALELLHAAISHLSNNFNRDIKDLVAGMLPRFTDRRYEHLQIDQDLKVRVFSAQKRDFMELEEVSSGTQRQIMLALRLALSQKLLSRKIKGQQFAFLDEPFAFFDEERTRNALIALADLGADISQVWIVAQTFPEDAEIRFDAHIACERGREELALN